MGHVTRVVPALLLACTFTMAFVTPADTAAPEIFVDPTSGPPGTQVDITGFNWVPNQPVMISQSGQGATGGGGTVQTDGRGDFSMTAIVADGTPPGTLTIVAQQQGAVASGQFQVTSPPPPQDNPPQNNLPQNNQLPANNQPPPNNQVPQNNQLPPNRQPQDNPPKSNPPPSSDTQPDNNTQPGHGSASPSGPAGPKRLADIMTGLLLPILTGGGPPASIHDIETFIHLLLEPLALALELGYTGHGFVILMMGTPSRITPPVFSSN